MTVAQGNAAAAPMFKAAQAVPGPALPALVVQGATDVSGNVYGLLRNGVFGLRSVLLTLCSMALLRIPSSWVV